MTETKLLDDLNEPQREAVLHVDGPLLILAGPGSGKTRVVVRRAAYLASTVARPWEILVITFTNKAAREMRERLEALDVADGMTICTFHALCAKLLRIHHERAGVARDYTIYDRDDRRKVIKKAISDCDLSSDNWRPAAVERKIGVAKGELLGPDEFASTARDWPEQTLARIYRRYDELMHEMGALDFDDLMMRMAWMVDRDPQIGEELEQRYPYLLIDEYQDTNAAQYKIALAISHKNKNICATGDPDQSIYGWRGANIGNILSFERDFPGAKVVRLEQNYRSTQRILSAADQLIAGNLQRKNKALWTKNHEGGPVTVIECEDGVNEAECIARDIALREQSGARLKGMAVFYRINSLSRSIEEAFLKEGIAYQVARGVEFYSRKEIKDVLGYLRVLVNPADEIALLRIINTPPRGIGATTVERLARLSSESQRSMFEVVTTESDLSVLGRSGSRVLAFGKLLLSLRALLTRPVSEALQLIVNQSGLKAMYFQEGETDNIPLENIQELINAAVHFQGVQPEATIRDWLEYTALISDLDGVEDSDNRVTLMTLHAAKGLEFPLVYIIGLEENMIPFRRSEEEIVDMEEERRLLFVGMTRAKNTLTLSHARYRMLHGREERTVRSPFLDELPQDELQWRSEVKEPGRPKAFNAGLPPDIKEWGVGTLVNDRIYGLGRILSIRSGGRRTLADIEFRSGPKKTFVLEFCSLERVDFDEVGD